MIFFSFKRHYANSKKGISSINILHFTLDITLWPESYVVPQVWYQYVLSDQSVTLTDAGNLGLKHDSQVA